MSWRPILYLIVTPDPALSAPTRVFATGATLTVYRELRASADPRR